VDKVQFWHICYIIACRFAIYDDFHRVYYPQNSMDIGKIGQHRHLTHLLMVYFKLGIVYHKLLEFFVTSLRFSTV